MVLRDGVLAADGALGGVRGVRGVVGSVGREHVRRLLDGGVLAAVRLAGARFPPPPGTGTTATAVLSVYLYLLLSLLLIPLFVLFFSGEGGGRTEAQRYIS